MAGTYDIYKIVAREDIVFPASKRGVRHIVAVPPVAVKVKSLYIRDIVEVILKSQRSRLIERREIQIGCILPGENRLDYFCLYLVVPVEVDV